jgi:hypothetical protein
MIVVDLQGDPFSTFSANYDKTLHYFPVIILNGTVFGFV